jgi:hypothetical protein
VMQVPLHSVSGETLSENNALSVFLFAFFFFLELFRSLFLDIFRFHPL